MVENTYGSGDESDIDVSCSVHDGDNNVLISNACIMCLWMANTNV